MFGLETIVSHNSEEERILQPLYWNPRIAALRESIRWLPIDAKYRQRLNLSLYKYADQIISRPILPPCEGWDDLEALQQVTLGERMEEFLIAGATI